MAEIDWQEVVDVEIRGAQRADASYRFSRFAVGSLASMIQRVLSRTEWDRQRVAIRSARLGRIGIDEMHELVSRPDFPRG